jgi:glycosyltransferase involved in cell wall biosynthesis
MYHETRKIKLVIITNMLAPYRIPLFEIISAHPRIELQVIVMDFVSAERKAWRTKQYTFPCTILKKKTISCRGLRYDLPLNLLKVLMTLKPDVIVSVGFSLSSIVAVLYSRFNKVFFYIWNAETILSYKMTRTGFAQDCIRKLLIRFSSMFLAYGPDAKEYLLSFGVEEKKVHVVNNICDAEPFLQTKREWKYKDFVTILYVGSLIDLKNINRLLQAYKETATSYTNMRLKLVGDGPLRSEVEAFRKECDYLDIVIQGEMPSTEIPMIMSEADFLVHPSVYDRWPHVILEAMATGLPILCSNAAGIPPYIVKDGENGYYFNPNLVEDIRDAMVKMMKNRNRWAQMGEKSLAIAKEHSIEKSANLFIDAILASF